MTVIVLATLAASGAHGQNLEDKIIKRGHGSAYVSILVDGAGTASSEQASELLAVMQLRQLEQIAANSARTAERMQSLAPLTQRIEALIEQVRILNEEQLVAIQRAVVTRLDTLPLQMVDDEAVAREIRRIAIEAVEAEFDLSRRTPN